MFFFNFLNTEEIKCFNKLYSIFQHIIGGSKLKTQKEQKMLCCLSILNRLNTLLFYIIENNRKTLRNSNNNISITQLALDIITWS